MCYNPSPPLSTIPSPTRLPEGKPIFTAAHNASSTSILLHWKPPSQSTVHGEFLGYRITLVPRDIPDPRPDQIVHITIKEHTATSHLVQGLRTYTQYLVSLQVFNPEGNGPTSTVAVMTDEGDIVYRETAARRDTRVAEASVLPW
ncbi:hypothetical protein Pcinc_023822 [Petrolisthes cinctipes]|uniref:Fibronectin type-III domain-containing protein n=1 Tax=Petrolisthes cinctipes TaxID=88211 RepID=A0AAE1FB20_PETCI|nr:hypothetical protein Pcinc_023822 [Petrolisthes cinctipes]